MVNMIHQTDVLVAGGGPAGLAAAIAARRRGFEVAVFEGVASNGPIDKCCGEGLMPDAIHALRQLGVVLPPSAGMPFAGTRFLDDGASADGYFLQQNVLGVRRTTLHWLMADHARRMGIALFRGAPVRVLAPGGVRVGDQLVRCRWIIGADGSQSALRRDAGLDSPAKYSRRFGSRRHFQAQPWSNLVEVYWTRGAQAYVTPISRDEVGVAIICRDSRRRFDELLTRFPSLSMRLAGAAPASNIRGAVTPSRRLHKVTSANVALIGDAGGSVDAITGLGLSIAFQQAVALGEALAEGDLASYEAAHRRIGRVPRISEKLMLAMDRHDWFRARVIRALAAEPAQFSRLLAVHAGDLPDVSSALRVPFALGWKFFTA